MGGSLRDLEHGQLIEPISRMNSRWILTGRLVLLDRQGVLLATCHRIVLYASSGMLKQSELCLLVHEMGDDTSYPGSEGRGSRLQEAEPLLPYDLRVLTDNSVCSLSEVPYRIII